MSKLKEFFETLKDGAWHSVDEISEKLQLKSEKILKATMLLAEANIVNYDQERRAVKINEEWIFLVNEE